jgi:hypothetical protein
MERWKKLTIKYDRDLVNSPEWKELISKIDYDDSIRICPQTGFRTLWLSTYPSNITTFIDINIIANLVLWFDNGKEEVLITENNYKEYSFEDRAKFYKDRLGIYDKTQDEL